MSRKAIIIWGIVIAVAIVGIVITYLLLNNGSSGSMVENNPTNTSEDLNSNINTDNLQSEESIEAIEQGQGSGDYFYWSIMPLRLQSKLPNPRSSGILDYYYSPELGIAFAYEVISLADKEKFLAVSGPEPRSNDNKIYLHNFEEDKESGQSIEIIDIEENLRFSTIPEIINLQILDDKQKVACKIEQQDNKYFVIAKDTKVKDSTAICGKYAKRNKSFFISPIQEGTAINKLLFVKTGDKELSYDGTMQGKYWYESVLVE